MAWVILMQKNESFADEPRHANLPKSRLLVASCGSSRELRFFVGVCNRVAFSCPDLGSLLVDLMFHEYFSRMLGFEFADEPGVPEFAGNSEIFAASHHRIGFAAF